MTARIRLGKTATIRLGTNDEIEQIIALQTASLTQLGCQDYDETQLAALVKGQDQGRRVGLETRLVAELENGAIVGFSSLSDYNPYITGLYVYPDFIRQGIGTRLLQELESVARRRKYKTLKVISSLTAVAFYRRQDFLPVRKMQLLTDERMSIPCELLKKELIPLTQFEKLKNLVLSTGLWLIFIVLIVSAVL